MRKRTKRRYKKYWKNLKEVKWHILLRFLLLIAMSVFFSTIATLLNITEMGLNSRESLLSRLAMMSLFFLIIDIIFMRKDYYILAHARKYRMVSYISHVAFTLANILMCKYFSDSYVYTFVFFITKFASYTHYEVSPFTSAVLFNAILIAVIHCAPVGMKKLYLHHG